MKSCVICSTKEEYAFNKLGYEIRRCPECDLYRTLPQTTYPKLLKNYYTKGYFTGNDGRAGYADYEDDHLVVRKNANRYLKLLTQYQASGRLLDIGCATGIFLEEANKAGFDGFGIDVAPYAIRRARRRLGDRVRLGRLRQNSFPPKSFDIITLFDVFEHFDQPRRELQLARRLLKPEGLIAINTGDTSSLLAKIQRENWHFFIPPQHLHFYSKSNLTQLIRSEGFEPIYTNSSGKHLTLRYVLQLARTINQSKIADWTYQLVHRNKMGQLPLYINLWDNMTIIAKKQ